MSAAQMTVKCFVLTKDRVILRDRSLRRQRPKRGSFLASEQSLAVKAQSVILIPAVAENQP
jgi:hypothetical protein